MKKSIRIHLTGNIQSMFFEQFIKENADKLDLKGYLRRLEDGRAEIFLEGNNVKVDEMAIIVKRGPQYTQIRKAEEKLESFQGFREFKILKI